MSIRKQRKRLWARETWGQDIVPKGTLPRTYSLQLHHTHYSSITSQQPSNYEAINELIH
jgi:hypothetical protein